MEFRYAHIHGFSSSSRSNKGLQLAKAFRRRGHELILPELNRPSFTQITYTKALEALDEMDREFSDGKPWRISASSMGAYLATLWAERNPGKVDRLVLLCPAFELMERFKEMVGLEAMEKWEREGSLKLEGPDESLQPVHWGFIEDGRTYPDFAEAPCPTVIIHGRQDPTIPIESSRRYAKSREQVELFEVEGDHSLAGAMDFITAKIFSFFELDSAQ